MPAELRKHDAELRQLKAAAGRSGEAGALASLIRGICRRDTSMLLGQRKLKGRIGKIFEAVTEDYPYIFPTRGEQIELSVELIITHRWVIISYDVG
jgi:hypothetical protein